MEKEILEKVQYCLNCKNPLCRTGCPLGNHIPDFIAQLKQGNYICIEGKMRENMVEIIEYCLLNSVK